jgi:hypothetical protein
VRYAASHACNSGDKCARFFCSCDGIDRRCVRREPTRCRRQQIDAAGAKFDHNQLHDGLQFSGGDLPVILRCAFLEQHVRRQHDGQRLVSEYLFESTVGLPNDLCAQFAVPMNNIQVRHCQMIGRSTRPNTPQAATW